MKKIHFTARNFIWIVCCILSGLVALILLILRSSLAESQESQQMAKRWSTEGGVAQISCFFSNNAGITEDRLISFEHTLDSVLQEASITLETENESARLWVDAYSAPGTIMVSSDRTSLMLNALGVGGDFFLFHPQKLLHGNYFTGNDLNRDYIIVDEETAWQLFGASDIAGKIVSVGGVPHVIAGVIERPQGKLEKEAGLDESIVYVSTNTLNSYGSTTGISHYEILMPNPINGFALQKVKENLGANERETDYVENTGRYTILSSMKILGRFVYRSMNGKAIIYPYWENLARGYEDIVALITLFMILLALVPAGTLFVWLIYRWRHRSWTVKSLWKKLLDLFRIQKERQFAKKTAQAMIEEEDYEEM